MENAWIPFNEAVRRFRLRQNWPVEEIRQLLRGAWKDGRIKGRGSFERQGKQIPSSYVANIEELFEPGFESRHPAVFRARDGFHYELFTEPAEIEKSSFEMWVSDLLCPSVKTSVPESSPNKAALQADTERYLSPFMLMMLEAIDLFGITETSHPKKGELEDHFKSKTLPDGQRVSDVAARYLATFCRGPDAMRGGNRRMG